MRKPLIYQWIFLTHVLSLDVALGACAMLHATSRALNQPVNFVWYALLFLGTLVVYWSDHLLDVKRQAFTGTGVRHAFFQKHNTIFKAAIIALILTAAVIALTQLSIITLTAGTLLFLLMQGYLYFHRKWKTGKEIQIALLYAASIITPVILSNPDIINAYNPLSFSPLLRSLSGVEGLFLLTLHNLLSLATLDSQTDLTSGIPNITHRFGVKKVRAVQLALLLLQSISLFLIPNVPPFFIALFALSILQYSLPFFASFTGVETVRWMGELVFLTGFLF